MLVDSFENPAVEYPIGPVSQIPGLLLGSLSLGCVEPIP